MELSVGSYNAHWGVDRRWQTADVVDVCRRLDADVITLQEVVRHHDETESFAARAAAELDYQLAEVLRVPTAMRPYPRVVRRVPEADAVRGQSILSRFPVGEIRQVELGRVPGDSAPRFGVLAELHTPAGPLTIVDVHLSHRPWGAPGQLRRLAAALAPYTDRPAVVAGDMNMWGPVVVRLLPTWRRAVLGRTFPTPRPHSQIDHVLVSSSLDVVEGEVVRTGVSDHWPVRARLRLLQEGDC